MGMALTSRIMGSATIKSTYSLDAATVRKVERLAARWKVSKSEVLRRAVAAARDDMPENMPPMEALRKVQKELNLSAKQAREWEAEVMRERRASYRNREWPGR